MGAGGPGNKMRCISKMIIWNPEMDMRDSGSFVCLCVCVCVCVCVLGVCVCVLLGVCGCGCVWVCFSASHIGLINKSSFRQFRGIR